MINFHPDPSSRGRLVDDFVDLLNNKVVKDQVKLVVSEMEKVPPPARP